MSILSVLMNSDHALVGVDTDAVDPSGRHIHMSKMLALPHANAVFAMRGSVDVFSQAFGLIHGMARTLDLVDLFPKVPALLDTAAERAHRVGEKQELVLVGWSDRIGGWPIGQIFRVRPGGGFYGEYIGDGYVGPPIANCEPWHTLADLVRVSKMQIDLIREQFPNGVAGHPVSGGGSLIVARISRTGLCFTSECDLGDAPGQALAGDRVAARELQGNMIIDGEIVTRTIAAENITVPRSAYTDGFNSGVVWEWICQTVNITTSGGVVMLNAGVNIQGVASVASPYIRVARDGVGLFVVNGQFSALSAYEALSYSFLDVPPAGPHTYDLWVNTAPGNPVGHRFLSALEVKR